MLSWVIYGIKVSQCEGLSLTVWIVRCERLSLMTGLNKFLGYLATLTLDLVCSEHICSFTIFVYGLAEYESNKQHFVVKILFVSMTM
jgi:hypothetical protein